MAGKHTDSTMEELLRRLDRDTVLTAIASPGPRQPASPSFLNAYGVCLLRLGKVYEALTLFNEITLDSKTLQVRQDAPDIFKVNLATARLMAKNPAGCLEAMRTVRDKKTEYCGCLLRAIRRWSKSLPMLQRLAWRLGYLPKIPIRLDFVPGEFESNNPVVGESGKEM